MIFCGFFSVDYEEFIGKTYAVDRRNVHPRGTEVKCFVMVSSLSWKPSWKSSEKPTSVDSTWWSLLLPTKRTPSRALVPSLDWSRWFQWGVGPVRSLKVGLYLHNISRICGGSIYIYINVCMHVCMYVCMYVEVYLKMVDPHSSPLVSTAKCSDRTWIGLGWLDEEALYL